MQIVRDVCHIRLHFAWEANKVKFQQMHRPLANNASDSRYFNSKCIADDSCPYITHSIFFKYRAPIHTFLTQLHVIVNGRNVNIYIRTCTLNFNFKFFSCTVLRCILGFETAFEHLHTTVMPRFPIRPVAIE